jgi:hypothetical protein
VISFFTRGLLFKSVDYGRPYGHRIRLASLLTIGAAPSSGMGGKRESAANSALFVFACQFPSPR